MSSLDSVDRDVYLWVTDHRLGWLDPLFIALTIVGYAGLLWILLAVLLSYATKRRPLLATVLTMTTVWSLDFVIPVLKELAGRPRPFETMRQADPLIGYTAGDSLPSGHAATAFAGAVILSVLFPRATPLLLALAAGVAFSRLYVGVHYLGDLVSGAALGAAWGFAAYTVFRLLARPLPTTEDRFESPAQVESVGPSSSPRPAAAPARRRLDE